MDVFVKDFQIVKQAKLTFNPGFNVIVGPSNNGKSSILKAIKAAIYTEAGVSTIRSGADSYVVGISHNNHNVVYQKKAGSTKYLVDGAQFSKFGLTTPEEVSNALNIKELNLNGNKIQLNFWNQMDKPFLLDKSAGDLFKFILDSGENDKLSAVTKAMVADRQQINRDADTIQGSINSTDSIIKEQEKSIENLKPLYDMSLKIIELKSKKQELDKLNNIYTNLNQIKIDLKDLDISYITDSKQFNIISILEKDLEKIKLSHKLGDLYDQQLATSTTLELMTKSIFDIKEYLELLSNLSLFADRLPSLLNLSDRYKIILNELENVSKINLVTPDVEIITELTNTLIKIKSISQKVSTIDASSEEQVNSEKSILDALDRIKEVEDCIEVCPCCGQSLKGGNHVLRISN